MAFAGNLYNMGPAGSQGNRTLILSPASIVA